MRLFLKQLSFCEMIPLYFFKNFLAWKKRFAKLMGRLLGFWNYETFSKKKIEFFLLKMAFLWFPVGEKVVFDSHVYPFGYFSALWR